MPEWGDIWEESFPVQQPDFSDMDTGLQIGQNWNAASNFNYDIDALEGENLETYNTFLEQYGDAVPSQDAYTGFQYFDNLFSDYYMSDEGSADSPLNTWTYLLNFHNTFAPYDISQGEMYRANESQELGVNLLRSQYRDQDMSKLNQRIGATGFASSGYSPRLSLQDKYSENMQELAQESESAVNQVYSSFGNELQDAIAGTFEQGGFDVGDDMYSESHMQTQYDDLLEDYGTEGGNISEALANCVDNYLGGDPLGEIYTHSEFGNSDYMQSGGNASNPTAFIQAVQYCEGLG